MNTRKVMTYVHLSLASLFMPLLLLMPFTGSMYILGFKGDQTKTESFRIPAVAIPTDEAKQESFFREIFAANSIDYSFSYIRGGGKEFTFRPSSRVHYTANVSDSVDKPEIVFSKIEPNLMKRLIEIHKGHGPVAMKWFEVAFGLALIFTTCSGLWLAWTVKPYRKATLISFGIGSLVIALCLI